MTAPFPYHHHALALDVRKHGPKGYVDYSSYKTWLRDEHSYRCVYCLSRERWEQSGAANFGVDHIVAKSKWPAGANEYVNLAYACNRCNSRKTVADIPVEMRRGSFSEHLSFKADGSIEPLSPAGSFLIDLLHLDDPQLTEYRKIIIAMWRNAVQDNDQSRLSFFEYPSHLSDLSQLRPPSGNSEPQGIGQSAFELRANRKLPRYY